MDSGSGFDYVNEKVDSIGQIDGRRRRTCDRCGVVNWVENMIKVGARWYCYKGPYCYDPPVPGGGGDRAS